MGQTALLKRDNLLVNYVWVIAKDSGTQP
jgi:hypothetical protein